MDKEIKNKIDFINQKAGKQTGFSTPKNYFDGIEEDVLNSIKTESFSKKNSFEVPRNYFDKIEDDIFAKINTLEPKETKVISLRKRVLQLVPIAAAASVLLFIGLNYFNTNGKGVIYTIDDISDADLSAWYENGYGDTNDDELALALNTTDLESDTFNDISDDNLEEYLNGIDSSTYLNELE